MAPSTRDPIGIAAMIVGSSVAVASVVALALSTMGLLRPLPAASVLLFATVLPLFWESARQELRRSARLLARSIPLLVFAFSILGLLVLVPSRLGNEGWLQPGTTSWYYAHLAEATRTAGGFPDSLAEWGTLRAFQTDYAAFTAHSAMVFGWVPAALFERLEVYRLAILGVAALAACALIGRATTTRIAVLGAVLLLGSVRLDERFSAYRPEAFALALGLLTLYFVDRAAVEKKWRIVLSASLLAALTFLAHLEVFLVVVAGAVAIALYRGPLRVRRGRLGVGLEISPRATRTVALVASVLVSGAASAILVNTVVSGEPRLLHYLGGQTGGLEAVPAVPTERIPPGWVLTGDATWDFQVAAAQPAQMGLPAPAEFLDPRLTPRTALWIWPTIDARTVLGKALLIGILATSALVWPLLPSGERRLIIFGVLVACGLVIGSYLAFSMADTYVPQRAGGRRVLPYVLLLPALCVAVLLAASQRRLVRGRGRGRRAAFWAAALVAVAVIIQPSAAGLRDRNATLSDAGLSAFSWIRTEFPGARLLTNAYTDGSVGLLAGAVGIIDGRAAYLEDPEFLGRTMSLILGARTFFADPGTHQAASFLEEEEVELLLVTGTHGQASDLAAYRPFEADLVALGSASGCELVRVFGDDQLRLYRCPSRVAFGGDSTQDARRVSHEPRGRI
jgi:hypothetical protein